MWRNFEAEEPSEGITVMMNAPIVSPVRLFTISSFCVAATECAVALPRLKWLWTDLYL